MNQSVPQSVGETHCRISEGNAPDNGRERMGGKNYWMNPRPQKQQKQSDESSSGLDFLADDCFGWESHLGTSVLKMNAEGQNLHSNFTYDPHAIGHLT
jgi:hypothetical protein